MPEANTDNPFVGQVPKPKVRLSKTPAALKAHPDYVRFNALMHGGVYYKHRELREILKSDDFKRFAALFPSSEHSGEQGPDSSDEGQPGIDSSVEEAPGRPTKP